MKRMLIAAAVFALLVLVVLAWRHFVTDSIMDGDGMENTEYLSWDPQGSWYCREPGDGSCSVIVEDGVLVLFAGDEELCRKAYYVMTDGIFRLYPLDSEGFGPFAYFDYSPGCLVGCAEESTEYLEFYP